LTTRYNDKIGDNWGNPHSNEMACLMLASFNDDNTAHNRWWTLGDDSRSFGAWLMQGRAAVDANPDSGSHAAAGCFPTGEALP